MKSASSIVFSDDFDNGRKPDWKVVSGAWSDVGGMLEAIHNDTLPALGVTRCVVCCALD